MSLVDEEYIRNISSRLRNFKMVRKGFYNCSCPICGDSKKNKLKARFYLIKRPNTYSAFCHNCGYSSTLPRFIKAIDSDQYKKYTYEKFKHGGTKKNHHIDIKEVMPDFETNDLSLILKFDCVEDLEEGHICLEYVKKRGIPKDSWANLFYTPDITEILELFPDYAKTMTYKDARLLIPYYAENGSLLACQARSLDPNVDDKGRYLSFKINDDVPLVYGLDMHNKDKLTFVVEGPLDSLFLSNSLASSNADLSRVAKYITKEAIYIYDNQPRNAQLIKMMDKGISKGQKIFIWPAEYSNCKDINDLHLVGKVPLNEIEALLIRNSFSGLALQLEYNSWKR